MKYKVYIDGQEGTTGLQLQKRLFAHSGVELLLIDETLRKDAAERQRLMRAADLVFLCLPDAASIEAVALSDAPHTKIIDASTAHRTNPAWAYGFPELSERSRSAVRSSRLIANPGCHATGFIAPVYPLVSAGLLPADYPFTCHSITGYSGGGKKMIASYEAEGRPYQYDSPRQYGLSLKHKHLPEMQKITGIKAAPIFNPIVCDFYSGMAVSVPVFTSLLPKKLSAGDVLEALAEHYKDETLISVHPAPSDGFIAANELRDTCLMKIYVFGDEGRITITSVFDNLGKGASGAAVQNMNLALGLPEFETLI